MDWINIFKDTLHISGSTIIKMVYIVIPLLICLECLKDSGWLQKISHKCSPITEIFKLPGETAIAFVVAMVAGLTYGSGVIIHMKDNTNMTPFQYNVLFIFIGICHALIEETVLFAAAGAYWVILVANRIIMAFLFTFAYILTMKYLGKSRIQGQLSKIRL